MTWKPKDLVEEATRRVTPRHWLPTLLVFVLAAGLAVGSATDLFRAEKLFYDQLAGGVTVLEIRSPDDDKLSSSNCAALSRNPAVISAGGIGSKQDVQWSPSGVSLTLADVSLGALRVWWPQAPAKGGLFVGPDLANSMGVPPGAAVSVDGGEVRVTSALPDSMKDAILRASVVRVVHLPPEVSVCLVRTLPGYEQAIDAVIAAAFPGQPLQITPYVRTDSLSASPSELLSQSSSSWMWIAAAGAVAIALALRGLMSRTETGIYRAVGTTRSELFFMSSLHSTILLLPAGIIGTLVGTAAAWWLIPIGQAADSLWFVVSPSLMFTLLVWLTAPFIERLATSGSIVDQLKE